MEQANIYVGSLNCFVVALKHPKKRRVQFSPTIPTIQPNNPAYGSGRSARASPPGASPRAARMPAIVVLGELVAR
jgi:hypothetical protein